MMPASQRSAVRPHAHEAAPRLRRTLGWLTVLMALGAIATALAADSLPRGSHIMLMHRICGWLAFALLVGLLVTERFVSAHVTDDRDRDLADWLAEGASIVARVLLFVLPILGTCLSQAKHHAAEASTMSLPWLTRQGNPELAYTLRNLHSTAAWALLVVLLLHAGLALWRHQRSLRPNDADTFMREAETRSD